MVMINRKQKELETFYRAVNLTNWVLLLQKGVFTMEEWADTNEKLTLFLKEKEESGQIKDYKQLLVELNAEVESWEDKVRL